MIIINKQRLEDLNACLSGFDRFIIATDSADNDVNVIDLIGTEVTTDDLLWLAGEILPKKKNIQFTVDCAELVHHLSCNKELAQNCIDAAKAIIENDTKDNRKAARKAARAYTYAGRATYDYPAYGAATAATYEYAGRSAVVARVAARVDINFDVNPLLVKLFTK